MKYHFCPSMRFSTCPSTLRGYGIAVRRFAAALAAFLLAAALAGEARAQATGAVGLPMVPLGYCQLSAIAAATGLASCSGGIPSGATAALMSIETTSARWRDDGTNPTASVGMPLAVATPLFYTGTLSKFAIIPTASTSTVNVLFYRLAPP